MKYCVIKNTITVIDGSENPKEVMLQNSKNAGLTDEEVEILTDAEYNARVESLPKPTPGQTELEVLKQKQELMQKALDELLLGGKL